MQKNGVFNERDEINKNINEFNKEKVIALQEYRELKDQLEKENAATQKRNNLKPDEIAAIQKSEGILKEAQTYENSKKVIEKLSIERNNYSLKLSNVDSEIAETENKLYTIKQKLDSLK